MSKIKADYNKLETTVLPALRHSKSYLDNASNTLKNAFIPREYSRQSNLIKTIREVSEIRVKIQYIEDFIVDANKLLDATEEGNREDIVTLDDIVIKSRVKIINRA